MNQIQDWITRYYASHDDIPAGHHDGEFLQALVRCSDCIWWAKEADSLQGRCALLEIHPTGAWFCANGKAEMDEVSE